MRLISLPPGKRKFRDLSEQEVLALAISSEEEDGRIYAALRPSCAFSIPPRPLFSTAWRWRKTSIDAD